MENANAQEDKRTENTVNPTADPKTSAKRNIYLKQINNKSQNLQEKTSEREYEKLK